MRYSLVVRADRRDLVEAVISKLPSHHISTWATKTEEGWAYHKEYTEGAVQVILPVGQLATLTSWAAPEGEKPTHYICSGEFTAEQLKALKDALKIIQMTKSVLREAEGEVDTKALLESISGD